MGFIAKYRRGDGRPATVTVEAVSRAEAVQKLKLQGIAAFWSLEEVVAGRGAAHVGRGGRAVRCAVFAAVVGTMACFLVVGLWKVPPTRKGQPAGTEPPTGALGRSVPAPAKVPAPAPGENARTPADEVAGRRIEQARNVADTTVVTNADGYAVETFIGADGGKHTRIREAVKPVFDNASDQLLALTMSAPPGQAAPPLPIGPGIDKAFMESLERPIVIADEDPPRVRAIKEAVIQGRAEMKQLVESGMTVQEVLAQQQKLRNEDAATRRQVVAELKEILAGGDIEGARKYVRQMNIALEQMGIMRVAMPPAGEEEKAAAAARKIERIQNKRQEAQE